MSEREIFTAALKKEDLAERAAFLDEACGGDSQLRQRVESLLAEHQQLGSFMDGPSPAVTAAGSSRELPGSVIGPYKLLEQIGEGGMGVVFMAEQQEPVRRKVALKLIKPGMDTRQVIARFEAERQALAVMDHPSIARVLDAGATESGRPYFVMELVRGVPITTYCDENHLAVRERLELFAAVCQAIQHAHTKGIIHRDIKPTNLLVTQQDGRPVVKVIDFGVAKAVGQQLTEKTLFTNFAQIIGTPLYMSPEQAEQSGVDIDTRSDIYSLGVLLYELLTGSTPVDAEQLKQAAFDEIRRIIREEEPQTPSARISGSQTLPAIAARRHIEPARLSKLVRGELDWIVMKALEKDRNRRYETANAFAADLLHYLNDEPVQACPPSATYRFGKFARRNRVALTTATLVAAALVLGTVVSTWQAVRAETARKDEADQRQIAEAARAAEFEQRKVAEAERSEAERQRELAEANFARARETVDDYFTLISESTLLDVPGVQALRKDLLDKALEFYKKTSAERTNDPSALTDMALAYLRVAQMDHAIGRNDDCVRAISSGLDIVDRLRRDYPDAADQHRRLAGFWKGYRPGRTRTEAPKNPLAALKTLQRAIATWQELSDKYPKQSGFRSDLASMCYLTARLLEGPNERESLRNYERSKSLLEDLVALQPDVPQHQADLARIYQAMVVPLSRAGRPDEAEAAAIRSLSLREALVTQYPDVPQHRSELALILSQRAGAIAKQQPAEAEKMFQRAVDLSVGLVRQFPEVFINYQVLGHNIRDWATYILVHGSPEQQEQFERAVKDFIEQATDASMGANVQFLREQLALARRDMANKGLLGNPEKPLLRAVADLNELARDFPKEPKYVEMAGHSSRILGFITRDAGRPDDALEHFDQGIAAFQKLVELNDPARDVYYRRYLIDTLLEKVAILAAVGRAEEAEKTSRQALEMYETLAREYPKDLDLRQKAAFAERVLIDLLTKIGRQQEAKEAYQQAVARLEKLGDDLQARIGLGTFHRDLGNVDQAIAVFSEILDKDPKRAEVWDLRGNCYLRKDEFAKAVQDYSEAIKLQPRTAWYWHERGWANLILGQHEKSITDHSAAIEIADQDAGQRLRRGQSYEALGELEKAQADYARAVELNPADWNNWYSRGRLYARQGQREKAQADFGKVIDLKPDHELDVAHFHNDLANELRSKGRQEDAEQEYQQAIVLKEKLVASSPANPDYRFHLVHSYLGLASLLGASGQPQEATEFYRKALALSKKLTADSTDNREYRVLETRCYHHVIDSLLAEGESADAEAATRQAVDEFDKLIATHPAVPDFQRSRAALQRRLALLLAADKRPEEAEKTYLEAINSYQKIIAEFPQYEDLWQVYSGLARALATTDQFDKADEARRKIVELAPHDVGTLNNLAWRYATAADSNARDASLAVDLANKGIALDPKNTSLPNTLGVANYRAGNWQDAIEWLTKSMEVRNGGDSFDWFFLAMAHWQLGDEEEALKWQTKAVEWMDANKPQHHELLRFRAEAEELIKNETKGPKEDENAKPETKPSP